MEFLKKLWNTIRYGDKKLAAYTLLIILLFAGAAVLFASAYTNRAIAHAVLGVAMIGLDLFLLSRLADEEIPEEEDSPEKFFMEESEKENPEEDEEDEEEIAPAQEQETQKRHWSFSAFLKKFHINLPERMQKDPKKKKPKGFKKVKVFPKDAGKEQVVMFLKYYKVKQNHITILIDNSKKYDIKQCPAYLWKDKRGIHLLLLEETTRKLVLPASSVSTITYKRAVPGNSWQEYLELREPSLKSAIFSSYIPEYYDIGLNKLGQPQQAKNLYEIAPDIQVSEKCAKEVMELLNLKFIVYDQYTTSDRYSEYFKEGHRYQILLRDQVIDGEEYKQNIQSLLKRMTTANIHEEVFDETIRQMVMYNMIGADYGQYYRAQRERVMEERQGKQTGKKKRKKK